MAFKQETKEEKHARIQASLGGSAMWTRWREFVYLYMRSDLTREGQEVRETIKKKKIENTHAQKATETCEYEAWLSLVKKKKNS